MSRKVKNSIIKGITSITVSGALVAGFIIYSNNGNIKTGCEIKHYEAVEDRKDMTLMIYMNGSSLESIDGAATEDMKEIINHYPEDSSLNIVVECGGTEDWETNELNTEGNKRFIINENGISNIKTLDERNMGDADTLSDFINYGIGSYPADKYALIFWDHGGGSVNGFGDDEIFDNDSLELSEIDNAFENSEICDEKLDFIGFDACLMSTVETSSILKDRADFLIASQEVEPSQGWNYEWLSCLEDKNIKDEDICINIVDKYFEFYRGSENSLTISVIDLSELDKFMNSFQEYLQNIDLANKDFLKALSKSRSNILSFGTGYGRDKTGEMADLLSLVEKFNSNCDVKCDLKDDIKKAVIYKKSTDYMEEPSGLSIYLPVNNEEELENEYIKYKKCRFLDKYIDFINNYNNFLLEDSGYKYGELDPYIEGEAINLQLQREDIENMAAAYLSIYKEVKEGSGAYVLVSTDSDVKVNYNGLLSSVPNNNFTYINNVLFSSIEKSFKQTSLEKYSPVLLNGEEAYLILRYDKNDCYGSVVGAIRGFNSNEAQNKIVNIEEGDKIVPLYNFISGTDISSLDEDKIYNNDYYIGQEIEAGKYGLDLSEERSNSNNKTKYSFILVDAKQEEYEIIVSLE